MYTGQDMRAWHINGRYTRYSLQGTALQIESVMFPRFDGAIYSEVKFHNF